jgi:hypothetical protein
MSEEIPDQRLRGDRSRIRLDEDEEVRYWSLELGVTEAELTAAVYQVGHNPEAVRQHIAGGRS